MNCFPCFQTKEENAEGEGEEKKDIPVAQPKDIPPAGSTPEDNPPGNPDSVEDDSRNAPEEENNTVKSFTFRELATATKHFRQETLLGEGGFGKVFKGTIAATGQVFAVRQLDRNGAGGKDFVFEVSSMSLLQHPNVVRMVGYCADGEQRLLVYEYLPSGCLEKYLFDLPAGQSPLDWTTRMKIALGIAEGLEYLHEKADPKIIYRDLKSSKVLMSDAMTPKLADCGLANILQSGNRMHASVMAGYNGYCAPEYERNGELTMKCDVYSFGVILLELITGRRALDTSRPVDDQSLVSWAQPIFKDPSKFPEMADPLLRKAFSVTSLNQAVGVAAMCLQEEPSARPFISDISAALSFLAMAPPEAPIPERLAPMLSRVSTSRKNIGGDNKKKDHNSDSSEGEEDDDEEPHSDKQESSSEYEYTDSGSEGSEHSEHEKETTRAPSVKDNKARCKSTKSKKLVSNSKRRSTKKSVTINSPPRSKEKKSSSRASSKKHGHNRSRSKHSDYSSSSDEEQRELVNSRSEDDN